MFTREFTANLLESQWNAPRWLARPVAKVLEQAGVVSAVMVTTEIHSNTCPGSRRNVAVSTIDDTKSIRGGILMGTYLCATDGNVYAVAKGLISIGKGSAGWIPRGSIVTQWIRN